MKHLHNFNTVAEYEAVKDTLEMPYIVSIDETDGLQYNTEVIRVPQGSGGSGGENGGDNYIYYKHRDMLSDVASNLWEWSQLVKISLGGQTIICPPYYASLQFRNAPEDIKLKDYIEEVCIDFGLKLELPGERVFTIEELIGADKNLLEYITKEDFYGEGFQYTRGVFIQHIDGTLYTADLWTKGGFSNNEANGVYASNGLNAVVIAKDTLGEMPWSSKPTTLVDEVSTTTNWDIAERHNTGADDTAKIAAFDADSAAARCANYTFPNGEKGYLPATTEVQIMHNFEYDIRELMNMIGGSPFEDVFMWTSLQYDAENAWYVRIGLNDTHHEPKSKNLVCRPVCAYIKNE